MNPPTLENDRSTCISPVPIIAQLIFSLLSGFTCLILILQLHNGMLFLLKSTIDVH